MVFTRSPNHCQYFCLYGTTMWACSVVIAVTMVTGKLEVFGEAEVPGCVYCIVPFNGRIVAAINNRVSAMLCLYMVHMCVCM